MVVNKTKLWENLHKNSSGIWKTDSELSYTEQILHTCQKIKRRENISTNSEDYLKKLFSIADDLFAEVEKTGGTEVEKAGGTEISTKEVIKKFVAEENIPYLKDRYNLIDILDTIDNKESRRANCLGKTILFSCLAEMIDFDLFFKLRKVTLPNHTFIRIKDEPDKDIETVANYEEMERISEGEGLEEDPIWTIPALWYSHLCGDDNMSWWYIEEMLNEILYRFPEFVPALFEKAQMAVGKNNISEAEKYLEEALNIFPEDVHCLILKGYIEYIKGNKKEAITYYEKAFLNRYADDKIRHLSCEMRSRIAKELGDKEAIAYAEADIQMLKENYKEALSILEGLLLESKEDAKTAIYDRMSVIYYSLNDYPKALECSEKAIKTNPSNPIPFYNRGVCLQRLGDPASAEANYREALRIDPCFIEAKKALQTLNSKIT